MQLSYYPYSLNFKYPFKIAHTERSHTDCVFVKIEHNGEYGLGECVFVPYYPESLSTFKRLVSLLELPEEISYDNIRPFIHQLKQDHPTQRFSIAAIDTALHNLCEKLSGISIKDHYQIPTNEKQTSFTIGICDKATMEKKLADFPDMSYYKLKVDQKCIKQMTDDFRSLSDKPFVVDANQGFFDKEEALSWCFRLKELGVEYIEQPYHRNDIDSHVWLKELSPIPIIADESFQKLSDFKSIVNGFDGVNIKLMKMGGLTDALTAIQLAQKMDLKIIIGCMSESSIAINAAWNLTHQADWVDLDGAMLLTNDPFSIELGLSDHDAIQLIKNYSRQS